MTTTPMPWDAYMNLPTPATPDQVIPALNSLFQGVKYLHSPQPPTETRRRLLSLLLASLSSPAYPLEPAQLEPTLSLIKLFGRAPAGSEELARENAIQTLLAYSGLTRCGKLLRRGGPLRQQRAAAEGRGRRPSGERLHGGIVELSESEDDEDPTTPTPAKMNMSMSSSLTDQGSDPLTLSESEALRTLCNVLMLHPSSRVAFPSILTAPDVRGLVRLVAVPGAGFLAGRLLFLLTSQPSDWIRELAEGGELVDCMEEFASQHLSLISSPSHAARAQLCGPTPNRTDILREHFKLAYNLMLQYGRQPATSTPLQRKFSDEGNSSTTPAASDSEEGSRSNSPARDAGASPPMGKKKRFWSHSPSFSSTTSEPSPSTSPETSNPSSSLGSSRAKSPRRFGARIKSAVSTGRTGSLAPSPSSTNLPASSSSHQHTPADGLTSGELSLEKAQFFIPLFPLYLRLACVFELTPKPRSGKAKAEGDDMDPSPLVRAALNSLLNFPIRMEELGLELSWLQPVGLPPSSTASQNPYLDQVSALPARLLEVLAWLCDVHFPVDVYGRKSDGSRSDTLPAHPDELVPRGTGASGKAEEMIAPVVLLLRKIALLREGAEGLKEVLLPSDIDRTLPLERHKTLIGHLVRIMSSILLPNSAYGVGELLYNLCDRDPATFSQELGYGNVAGFLQNRGELIAPPPPAASYATDPRRRSSESVNSVGIGGHGRAGGRGRGGGFVGSKSKSSKSSTLPAIPRPVNPITGAYEPSDIEAASHKAMAGPQMTEEEKLREAERLYVLFDRLEKSGVMSVENPIKQAQANGKFAGGDEDEDKKRREEEDKEEEEVEAEMRRYKERKQKVAQAA